MDHPRRGKVATVLIFGLAAGSVIWSWGIWAAAEGPWWAPILALVLSLTITVLNQWNNRKLRRVVRHLRRTIRQRDDIVAYLIDKGVIDEPPEETGFRRGKGP